MHKISAMAIKLSFHARVGRPPSPRPASARNVGRRDVRQFFPLAHLAPIFTQPMGGSSTHNNAAGSSSEIPIVVSDAPRSAPTATAACAAVSDTLTQFMEDYRSSDEDKPAEVGGLCLWCSRESVDRRHRRGG